MIMESAILADKKNPVPMYQKANILMSLENFDEALEVLEELKEYAPRESSVYALMGKIYKRRNMHDRAMLHYGMALDLKPSTTDAAAIKVICLQHQSFFFRISNHFHSLPIKTSVVTYFFVLRADPLEYFRVKCQVP